MGHCGSKVVGDCCLACDSFLEEGKFQLALETQVFGWAFRKEHREALLGALIEWKCEVLVHMVANYLTVTQPVSSRTADVFRCRIRKDVFVLSESSEWPLGHRLFKECVTHWSTVHPICSALPSSLQFDDALQVAILGDGGVGKSALVIRFVCGEFLEEYDPTIEDSYRKSLTFDSGSNQMTMRLDMLDTAGSCEYSSFKDRFLHNCQVAVICANLSSDVDAKQQFEPYIRKFARYKGINFTSLGRYSQRSTVQIHGEIPAFACVVLVGTKGDLPPGTCRLSEAPFSEELDAPYIETSAKYNVNIDLVFRTCVYEYWLKRQYFK